LWTGTRLSLASARRYRGGTLALLAGAAIEACDLAPEVPAIAPRAGRAVIGDDGVEVRLTLFTQAGAVAVTLDPVPAIGLTAKLMAAALPRLSAP